MVSYGDGDKRASDVGSAKSISYARSAAYASLPAYHLLESYLFPVGWRFCLFEV